VFIGFFAPADMRIIIGRFEWWFKQCDESNLNRSQLARDFRQHVIKERTALWLVTAGHNCGFTATLLDN
jgi:hypothetical protein